MILTSFCNSSSVKGFTFLGALQARTMSSRTARHNPARYLFSSRASSKVSSPPPGCYCPITSLNSEQ